MSTYDATWVLTASADVKAAAYATKSKQHLREYFTQVFKTGDLLVVDAVYQPQNGPRSLVSVAMEVTGHPKDKTLFVSVCAGGSPPAEFNLTVAAGITKLAEDLLGHGLVIDLPATDHVEIYRDDLLLGTYKQLGGAYTYWAANLRG